MYKNLDFQRLAIERAAEAELLLNGQRAFYLTGYAIELALKVVLAKRFRSDEIPDLTLVKKIYSHDLSALATLAGLDPQIDAQNEDFPLGGGSGMVRAIPL
jgi:hypothetical protein